MAERLAPPLARRDFLGLAALSTMFAAFGTAVLGMLRLPKPTVYPVPSQSYKIGTPAEFPVGEARMPEGHNVFVFHDDNGFFAISAVCTHLGCMVKNVADGFACPCHGSQFNRLGRVAGGPAPRPLDWFELSVASDGQLVVDEAQTVKPGTYFKA